MRNAFPNASGCGNDFLRGIGRALPAENIGEGRRIEKQQLRGIGVGKKPADDAGLFVGTVGTAAVGGARVSPTHGNFIVNDGGATAASIRTLIDRCKNGVRDAFGVELREEIVDLDSVARGRETIANDDAAD